MSLTKAQNEYLKEISTFLDCNTEDIKSIEFSNCPDSNSLITRISIKEKGIETCYWIQDGRVIGKL